MYWSAGGEGSFKTRQSKIEKYVPSFNTHRGSKQSKGTDKEDIKYSQQQDETLSVQALW